MAAFNALYYPSWDPPVKWLRSMLLFFDRVEVILPDDVDPQYDPANAAVFDLIPHVFGEIKRRQYEMRLNVRNKEALEKGFKCITPNKTPKAKYRDITILQDDDGRISVPGHSFLHLSKINPYVMDLLERNSLIDHEAKEIIRGLGNYDDYHVINSTASALILSLIADHYAKEQSLRSITDKSIGYFVNACNTTSIGRIEAATMTLASSVLSIEIPSDIETLTAKQYINLRSRYEDIREPFQHAVRILCDDYQLAQMNTRKQFKEAVHTATRDFCIETENMRKEQWAKRKKKWTFMGVGIFSSFCTLGSDTLLKLGVGVTAGIHAINSLKGPKYITDKRHAQQLLCTLKGELNHRILLRRIGKS